MSKHSCCSNVKAQYSNLCCCCLDVTASAKLQPYVFIVLHYTAAGPSHWLSCAAQSISAYSRSANWFGLLQVPIIAPIKAKKAELLEQQPLKTNYNNEFLSGMMTNPELIRNVAVVGHLHHGKTLVS